MDYGNTIHHTNTLDKRYFPVEIKDVIPGSTVRFDLTYTAGARGNIALITDAVNSGRSQTFTYDLKDQLVSASGSYGTFAWTYDALGNRTVQTISGSTETHYSYVL